MTKNTGCTCSLKTSKETVEQFTYRCLIYIHHLYNPPLYLPFQFSDLNKPNLVIDTHIFYFKGLIGFLKIPEYDYPGHKRRIVPIVGLIKIADADLIFTTLRLYNGILTRIIVISFIVLHSPA